MSKLTRRTTTIALLVAGTLGSAVVAGPANAATPTTATTNVAIIAVAPASGVVHPGQTGLLLPAVHPSEIGLLLPAVQKVREAAAR